MGRRRSRRRKSKGSGRRRVLTALGGGITDIGAVSLLTESGAFSSLTASRSTNIDVAADEWNALVGLDVTQTVTKNQQQQLVSIQNNTGETITITLSLTDCSQGTLSDADESGCSVTQTIAQDVIKSVDIQADKAETIPFTITATSGTFSFEATRETTAQTGNSGSGPTADAGGPYTVDETNSIELDGTGSTGSSLSYSWAITDGGGSLDDATTSTPIYNAPPVEKDTTVTAELTVTDNKGQTDTETVTISVTDTGQPDPGALPTVDTLTVTKTGNKNQTFAVQADVSDSDGDLQEVVVTATWTQNSSQEYTNTIPVSGSSDSISDTTSQLKNKKEYRIEVTVYDANGGSSTESTTRTTD